MIDMQARQREKQRLPIYVVFNTFVSIQGWSFLERE